MTSSDRTDRRIYLDQANFPGLSASAFLEIAAASGADAVDLHPASTGEPADTVVDAALRTELEVCCVSPVPSWFEPWLAGREFPAHVHLVAQVAGALGTRIGVPSPVYDPLTELPPDDDSLVLALRALTMLAARYGSRVGLEPVGESVKFPGRRGAIGSLRHAARLASRLEHPVDLIADTYCLGTSGDGLITTHSPAERPAVIQVADREPGTPGRRLPGEGHLPIASWLNGLVPGAGFPILGVEVFPLERRDDPASLAVELVSRAHELAALIGMTRGEA